MSHQIRDKTVRLSRFKYKISEPQRKFLYHFQQPFVFVEKDGEQRPRVNTIENITRTLDIASAAPYSWLVSNEIFADLFEKIRAKRFRAFDIAAEDKLADNCVRGREVSLFFYLKNRLSDRWHDDNLLQRIHLDAKNLQFNFIATKYNNMDVDKLSASIDRMSTELSRLKGTTTYCGVPSQREEAGASPQVIDIEGDREG